MESNGEPFKIHMSASTAHLLSSFSTFLVEKRGELEIKGKGKMVTYWLCGEKDTKEDTDADENANNIFVNQQLDNFPSGHSELVEPDRNSTQVSRYQGGEDKVPLNGHSGLFSGKTSFGNMKETDICS